jgi:hypothetical protein
VETTLSEGIFHSRDANKSRDARNVGNNSSRKYRKYFNSSSHGGKSRDFSHSGSFWDVNSSKNNSSSRGTPATAETIITTGTQGKPTTAINIGHSSVSSNSRGSKIIMGC